MKLITLTSFALMLISSSLSAPVSSENHATDIQTLQKRGFGGFGKAFGGGSKSLGGLGKSSSLTKSPGLGLSLSRLGSSLRAGGLSALKSKLGANTGDLTGATSGMSAMDILNVGSKLLDTGIGAATGITNLVKSAKGEPLIPITPGTVTDTGLSSLASGLEGLLGAGGAETIAGAGEAASAEGTGALGKIGDLVSSGLGSTGLGDELSSLL